MYPILRRLKARWLHTRDALALSPAAKWLSLACLAVFLMQRVSGHVEVVAGLPFGDVLRLHFGLCPPLLASGFVWQVVTYMFLHGNWAHLLLNTLTLLLFGSALENEIGSARFLRVFFLGGIVGGLAWAGFDLGSVRLATGDGAAPAWLRALAAHAVAHRGTTADGLAICMGASGGVFALIGAYAALFPRRRLIVFIGWPVVLQARYVAILLGCATIALAIYGLGNVAYMTHLFGGLAGYLFGLRLEALGWGEDEEESAL